MPDAMTRLLANVGLSDLERRLRDEAIDETTFLDLDDEDLEATQTKLIPNAAVRRRAAAARSRTARAHLDAKTQVADDATARIQALEAENAALRDRLRLSVDRETEAAAKLREATRENARLQKDAKSANNYKNRAKKATARADELDRVLASVLAHSQHLEAELATLRNMPRLLVRNTTAPPVTPGDGDSAY